MEDAPKLRRPGDDVATECHSGQAIGSKSDLDKQTDRHLKNLERSLEWLHRDGSHPVAVAELGQIVDELRETIRGLKL